MTDMSVIEKAYDKSARTLQCSQTFSDLKIGSGKCIKLINMFARKCLLLLS